MVDVGLECKCPGICLNFMAIEPATGNSLMHTAILAQRIDLLDTLRYYRPRSDAPFMRQFELLYSHQNHDGDTILHLAARTSRRDLVTAAYQVYVFQDIDSPDESLQSTEPAESMPSIWSTNEGEEGAMRIAEILFLIKENAAGRTAADEARALGQDDIAAWLERALQLCDPKRERDDPSCVQVWQDVYLAYYGLRSQKTDDLGKPIE